MLVLAAAETIGAGSSSGNIVLTIMGMELNGATETYKTLYQGQITNTPAVVYTVPGSTVAFVKSLHVVNLARGNEAFALYAKGVTDANRLTANVTLREDGYGEYDENGWQLYGPVTSLDSIEVDGKTALLVVDPRTKQAVEELHLRLDEMAQTRSLISG